MDQKKQWLKYLPVGIGVALALGIALAVFLLKDLFQKPAQAKKQVQQVTIIQPPPPPPPPPEVKPPEPEVKEEKIEEPKPEPEPEPEAQQPDEAPPGEQLGVDGDGAAGSDAFGLVGKKGGKGLIGGGGGNAVIWYGGQIRHGLEDELHSLLTGSEARKNGYSVVVKIWIGPEGRPARAELAEGSGKAEVDRAIQDALPKLRLAQLKPPPENMPQPVKIRVTSRI